MNAVRESRQVAYIAIRSLIGRIFRAQLTQQ